jgi:hypothetical protein
MLSILVVKHRRTMGLLAITFLFGFQSLVSVQSGLSPFAMWSSTFLLLVPAFLWLVASTSYASLVATCTMALFLVIANWFGGYGYLVAFWLGLPISAIAAWIAAKRST